MTPEPQRPWILDDYLVWERAADVRHELVDGEVVAMAGASRRHNRIAANVVAALHDQLKARGCEEFAGDMRLVMPRTGFGTYPDVVVVCDPPRFHDEEADTLIDATLLVEVLSPSTEDFDRGRKLAHYRTLDSLRTVLLIAQDRVHVERIDRQADGTWLLSDIDQVDATLRLDAVGAELSLSAVYDRVPGVLDSPEN